MFYVKLERNFRTHCQTHLPLLVSTGSTPTPATSTGSANTRRYKTRAEFNSDTSYGSYVQSKVEFGMCVVAGSSCRGFACLGGGDKRMTPGETGKVTMVYRGIEQV